ncbi:pantoate--beta-alanine ligase [Haloflavibacter putidus]|uniref:Pantothenate synthetase n=1 Tax=Haloflavibacter putidus TaxID=2576776 RepID=A0A507ZVK0_9FLAO|nr:pantoate--beta-alanine ligase [Haloflavibacter putidus]TQD40493.1 pantoate--beta-alanine ligase [Haloflavibacter putidus]
MQSASNILILHDLKQNMVQVFHTKEALNRQLLPHRNKHENIGLVPTMGALHTGHISLINAALQVCDVVVVSIFVNPTQFNNSSDLDAYPRSLETDIKLLEKDCSSCIVFAPETSEIYPNGLKTKHFEFGELAAQMEGKYRNGHFDGVGTVLENLFTIVQPDKAFFGEKDYQQLLIVKKLVQLTKQSVEIIGCPINREKNGLAKSSRNKRLTAKEQEEASFIYTSLQQVKHDFGIKNAEDIGKWVEQAFKKHPFLDLEYFEIANAESLLPIGKNGKNSDKKYRAFIAAYANQVRLIDNIALN